VAVVLFAGDLSPRCGLCGGLLPFVVFIVLSFFKVSRQGPPGFLLSTAPEHKPFVRQGFAKKNTTRAQRGWRFFFSKPAGHGLVVKRLVSEIC